MIEPLKDVQEWKCKTRSKKCSSHDPCYFNEETHRCPIYGFIISVDEVSLL